MRRSAAPSQAVKKQKFVTPFLTNSTQNSPASSTPSKPSTSHDQCQDDKTNGNPVLQKIFALKASTREDADENSIQNAKRVNPVLCGSVQPKKARTESPSIQKAAAQFTSPVCDSKQLSVTGHSNNSGCTDAPEVITQYFSVVWCKRSSKKHKKWEGDAVLVTKGRSVTLYDIEGKEIGKSTGYKSTELASLKEDETLPVGGKEIQVMSVLTEDQFTSGKCFTAACAAPATVSDTVKQVSKPFVKPLKANSTNVPSAQNFVSEDETLVKARYDPNMPGALVMPRPSQSHQWMWNKKSACVVDVVVDPYLTCHLRPHQQEGVSFLYECLMGYRNYNGCGAILADDMGLGKTLQCISLIWTLYKQGPYGGKPVVKKILIITPGSLVKNWHQEFKKWLGFERLQVFAVSSDRKIEDFVKSSIYPVLLISYEMFVRVYDTIKQLTFDLVVCDEGHRLKNTTIKTTSLIRSLPTKKRVVLTGTPIQNDLQEFFSIVEFCNPGVLGSSAAFRRVYEDPIIAARQPNATPAEVSLGEERGAELTRMTQMFVLRRTQEINKKYLPPKCEVVLFCKPTPLQLRLYQQLLRCQLIRKCLSGNVGGSPHLICIAALKQLCNHPSLIYSKCQGKAETTRDGEKIQEEVSVYEGLLPLFPEGFSPTLYLEQHSGKLGVLSCLLHQLHTARKQEKIVVVSNHTKTLDMIQCMCEYHSYEFMRLDGQTPVSRRQELVQKFNSKYSTEFIFLLSSKAGGVGLNLIGASRLVLYDIDWNPANDLQAMARVWRDGQKHKVHIYRLLTMGSIEEKVFQRQIIKQSLSGAIMDVREKNDVQFSLEDLKDLFSINLTTECDTHDLLNCKCGTSEQVEQEPVQQTVSRSCQLGMPANKQKSRSIGMDELMDWKHYPGEAVCSHPEWYLEEAVNKISYVFHIEHIKQQ